jgi:aspartyl-tRNA(Asn)/glutamyl-tRNA(Gln) amidotransferase subunit C
VELQIARGAADDPDPLSEAGGDGRECPDLGAPGDRGRAGPSSGSAFFLRVCSQNACSYSERESKSLTIIGVSSKSSPVSLEVVRHVAALARLRFSPEELPALTHQLARILSYIDQLKEIREEPRRPPEMLATPLREDTPEPGSGQRALEENSVRLEHGYGAVPRVVGGAKP